MSLNAVLKVGVVALACVVSAGCGTTVVRHVTTVPVLQRGTVDCHWRQVIWESSSLSKGCDVAVTYRGTETCQARLLTISPTHATGQGKHDPLRLTPGQATEPAGPEGRTVRLRDVQTVWLTCGDQNGERHPSGCFYTIDRVNCSLDADQIETVRVNAANLANATATCGELERAIWVAPIGQWDEGCHVTVRIRGGDKDCRGIVECEDSSGRTVRFATPWVGDLLTLVNVRSIFFRCGNRGETGTHPCTCEIVQIDCPQ